jgi:hypothetical protein
MVCAENSTVIACYFRLENYWSGSLIGSLDQSGSTAAHPPFPNPMRRQLFRVRLQMSLTLYHLLMYQ